MPALVFLLDIDNTLINNDRVKADLETQIRNLAGDPGAKQFWGLYEEVRLELGYVDLPITLARFRSLRPDIRKFPQMSSMLLGYSFEDALYPRAMDVVIHLKSLGTAVVLSDGDPVFQPAKIARIGVADAVDSNVLVFAHKEEHLDEVTELFPARHYVLIDDKPTILATVKSLMGPRVTTVHVQQGQYARIADASISPRPDLNLKSIAQVLDLGAVDFDLRATGLASA